VSKNRISNPTLWPLDPRVSRPRAEADLEFAAVMIGWFGLAPELVRIADRAQRILDDIEKREKRKGKYT